MLDEMSIIKYGLSSINNIDLTKSFEIYDIHTNNHIINLFLIKDDKTCCPACNSNNIKYLVVQFQNLFFKVFSVCTFRII